MIIYFLAVILPFVILMLLGPLLIKFLKKLNFGQQIRGQGPKSHLKKEGIPTMGGILIIFAILATSLILLEINNYILWSLFITMGMGFLGFIDDFIKIRKQKSLGLKARHKISGQLFLAVLLAFYVYLFTDLSSYIIIPFLGSVNIGRWIIPLIIITVTGTANAVNITDGLDGLAASITAVVCSSLALITSFLNMTELSLFSLIITGACIGFIWFNSHPAQVFMGDVGSLALGGAVASVAVFSGTQIFLLIIGAVYVMETLSVMVQVLYFKITGGKRVFKMTPIHHHYELEGLDESKIVARFLILSMVFAGLGLVIFYLSI